MKVAKRQTGPSIEKNNNIGSVIPIPAPDESIQNADGSKIIAFPSNRISLEKLRSIWNDEDDHYTDEQLLQIRDWLYTIAELSLSVIVRQNSTSIPQNNPDHSNDTAHVPNSFTIPVCQHTSSGKAAEESHSVHPRIYRRAG